MKKVTSLFIAFALFFIIGTYHVDAKEVTTLEELEQILTSGGEVELGADFTDVKTITIPEGVTVILDLNGHSITAALSSTDRHYYAIDNYGTFTLKDSVGGGKITARGIENIGGDMTVESGEIIAQDSNGGAAIWNTNNTTQVDDNLYAMKDDFNLEDEIDKKNYDEIIAEEGVAIANPEEDEDDIFYSPSGYYWYDETYTDHIFYLYLKYKLISEGNLTINDGTFKTIYEGTSSDKTGPGCLNNSAVATINGGKFESVNKRTYAIISTGTITLNGNPTVIGAHGGLAIDGGTAIVNGGSYTSTEYYGLYVSNDGSGTDPNYAQVTVNGGTFTGASKSVWIGSDVKKSVNSTIEITDGTFNNPLNVQKNVVENEGILGIKVTGGKFVNATANNGNGYVADGYKKYVYNDSYYIVAKDLEISENNIILEKDETTVIPNIPETIKEYVTITSDNEDIIAISSNTITGKNTGKTKVTITVNYYNEPVTYEIPITVYNVSSDEDTKTNEDNISAIVKSILEGTYTGNGVSNAVQNAIKTAVENNETIYTEVTVDNQNESNISKTDKQLIQNKLNTNENIAGYFDINFMLHYSSGQEIGKVTELINPVTISLDLPSDIEAVKDGYTRTYYILRIHDGIVDRIETTLITGKLVFETDKFSTYALTYIDTKNSSTKKTTSKITNPSTNDNITTYAAFLLLSLGGVVISRRKLQAITED